MDNAALAKQHYQSEYERIAAQLPGGEQIKALRKSAMTYLEQHDFPTRKDEDWKYTSVLPILGNNFRTSDAGNYELDISNFLPAELDAHVAVIIDGQFQTELCTLETSPETFVLIPTKQALNNGQIENIGEVAKIKHNFDALNMSFANDGYYLKTADNAVINKPIIILHIASDGHFNNLRNFIHAGKNSESTVVELFVGNGQQYFTNAVSEIICEDNARLEHIKIQNESDAAFHISQIYSAINKDASLNAHSFALGGTLNRSDVNADLMATGAHCTMNGLYLLNQKQHTDHHTAINHLQPHTTSTECYKGVIADSAHAVFNGKVFVEKDAQKTASEQRNQNILLSKTAKVDTKPQLEIFADDVKCAHGATVGQLDNDALFYLRSRGIPAESAQHLLLHAFSQELINQLKNPEIKSMLLSLINKKLQQIEVTHGN